MRRKETLVGLEQENVARFDLNVADPALHLRASAVDCENRGVVDGSKLTLPDGATDERRRRGHDGFDEGPNCRRCIHLRRLGIFGANSGDSTKLPDARGVPHEAEDVTGFQGLVSCDGAKMAGATIDSRKEEIG